MESTQSALNSDEVSSRTEVKPLSEFLDDLASVIKTKMNVILTYQKSALCRMRGQEQ